MVDLFWVALRYIGVASIGAAISDYFNYKESKNQATTQPTTLWQIIKANWLRYLITATLLFIVYHILSIIFKIKKK